MMQKGKTPPLNAIPCCEPDEVTGHHPHWVKCDRNLKADRYFFEAYDSMQPWKLKDGTYELVGIKVNGNPEKIHGHTLIKHGSISFTNGEKVYILKSAENLKMFLSKKDIEGIVFHHPDGRMCKIRKKDFGFVR